MPKAERKQKTKHIPKWLFGFDVNAVKTIDTEITMRELVLLYIIIQIYNSDFVEELFLKNKQRRYVWIAYTRILQEFEWCHYTDRMLRRDLNNLEASGYIDRYESNKSKSKKIYFYIPAQTRVIFKYKVRE